MQYNSLPPLAKLASFTRWLRTQKGYVEQIRFKLACSVPVILALSHLPHLKKLHIQLGYEHADQADVLVSLDALSGLQELGLDTCEEQEEICVDMSCLAGLTSLTSLQLGGHIQMLSLQHTLPELAPDLCTLQLNVGNWEQKLGSLSCLTQLEGIDLSGGDDKDLLAEPLVQCFAAMSHLTSVSLACYHAGLEHLRTHWSGGAEAGTDVRDLAAALLCSSISMSEESQHMA